MERLLRQEMLPAMFLPVLIEAGLSSVCQSVQSQLGCSLTFHTMDNLFHFNAHTGIANTHYFQCVVGMCLMGGDVERVTVRKSYNPPCNDNLLMAINDVLVLNDVEGLSFPGINSKRGVDGGVISWYQQ